MAESKIVIHIGANKTASTTFQRNSFIRLNSLVYRGEEDPKLPQYYALLDSIINDDPIYYRQTDVAQFVSDYLSIEPEKLHLISFEDISRSRVISLCAQRLAQLFPKAKILFVIRNQLEAIQSWYVSHGSFLRDAPKPYWRRYVSFDNWLNHQLQFRNGSHLEVFRYDTIITPFEAAFSRENIHILFYETLVQEPKIFCHQMAQILGLEAAQLYDGIQNKRDRKRATKAQFIYQRIFGRLWPVKWDSINDKSPYLHRLLNSLLNFGLPYQVQLEAHQKKIIFDYYKDCNAYLKNHYQLPVDDHGYPL